MTPPAVGLWRDDAHRYYARYPDDPRATGLAMPGVTSVISKVDKSGPLIAWAKGVTADAALNHAEVLPQRIATDGRAPTKAWLTAIATAESDRAKDLGSRVHALAEQIERGATPDVEPLAFPYIEAYRRFRVDFVPRFKSLEQFVWSPTHLYGGTFDWLAYLDLGNGPKLTLGDTKSGKGHYIESRLQLAALGMAEFIGVPGDAKRYPMPRIEQYAILHVRPEAYARGYQLYRVEVNQADRDAFLGALAIYRWSEQRPSKGEPVPAPAMEEDKAA